MNRGLFPDLVGAPFDGLPPSVRALHLAQGLRVYRGEVEVTRGRGWLSRLFAWATRLPPAGRGPVEVEIEAIDGRERWVRRIGGRAMPSRLWPGDGLLCERLGLVVFGLRLSVHEGVLDWRVARVRALGVPLPARAFADVRAYESEHQGRYRFEVAARLPVVGPVVAYRGWLQVEATLQPDRVPQNV